jgi:CheY-like chemotaxis protein
MLVGDALRIQQILANLIGNALKFTAEGSVTLEVNLVELESSQARLCFSVTDSGIGLTPEDQAKLFTPFSQVDTSITRRFGGTGLGLSISHGLLQLMGGSFRIESTVGVGSSFSFELQLGITSEELHQNVRQEPIKRGAGSLSEKLQTRGEQLKGKRILVAEDNHINQLVVMEFLSLSGVIITIANNGLEALELLQQFSYDAILMDVHMPVMGGVEATAKIRQQGYTLPIIALTAGVTQEERDNCKHIGMNDFITKPVNPEELISVLCHWIATDNLPDSVVSAITEPAVEEEMPVSPPFIMALPGFDLTIVLSMVGGDEKIVHELLQIFREDLLPSLQAIEDNITASNFRAAADLAHRIKGTAGNLGGMELHSVAANLEASLKQGSLDNDVWVEFKRVMRATAIALEGI